MASTIDLQSLFEAGVQERNARQSDGAGYDMRLLGGVLAGALLASNDAQLNAAVRTPSTLSSGDAAGAINGPK